jgi:hypothetical protein
MTKDQGSVRRVSGRSVGISSVQTHALRPTAERATREGDQIRRISVLRCSRPAARPANISLIDCRDTAAPRPRSALVQPKEELGLDTSFHISV